MSVADDCLKVLIKKRATIKSKLTNFDKYLKTFEGLQDEDVDRSKVIELEQRITSIEEIYSKFDDVQGEIECTVEDPEPQFFERDEFENKYYPYLSRAKSLFEKFNDDTKSSSSSIRSLAHSSPLENVKLPEIKLPKFDGTYENWLEFRDIFESMIHNNTQINNVQKFHYLRASLVGSAPQVVQSLEFSSDNYTIAWNTLCDRFNNKQLLIQNHLRAIFNMENIVAGSSSKIRFLYENLFKHLSSLKQLGEPTDSWDTLLIYVISSKLDKYSCHEWEKLKSNRDDISLENFKDFLKKRATLLETIELNHKTNDKPNDTRQNQNQGSKYGNRKPNQYSRGLIGQTESNEVKDHTKTKFACFYCKGDHSLFHCPDFLKLSVKDRISKTREMFLCVNCLRKNHLPKDCRWSGCKICGSKHNTILHEAINTTNSAIALGQENEISNDISELNLDTATSAQNITNCSVAMSQHAILSTAKVQVVNGQNTVSARALLDCGSQSSFITSSLCKKLNINKTRVSLAVSGISDKLSYANFKCDINIQSMTEQYSFKLSCFVLEKITSDIPDGPINIEQFSIPVNLSLADPDFYIPQPIDILIGADMFWHLLSVGRINIGKPDPILQNTRLGWVIAGSMPTPTNLNLSRCNISTISVQEQLSKFWEVEEIDTQKSWSAEEQLCENHFSENLCIDGNGRFIVSLPLKDDPSKLGASREIAIKRFLTLERKLLLNDTLRNLYVDFLSEYERLDHMTEVITDSSPDRPEYFMPHHGVLKETNISTKLRVVFNASSPTSTGISLNDIQMAGPTIQEDLFSILLRFRAHKIVLSSDIQMMYRQILIDPNQRRLQRIVWRSSPNEPIKIFQLNTVTYGTKAASFLATRCLHEIAQECENEHPKIANIIRNDMYVDDLLTSVDTAEEAEYICKTITKVFLNHGFILRKWKSNDDSILHELDSESSSKTVEFLVNKDTISKTLGLLWESDNDYLGYKVQPLTETRQISKRVILSRIATIFDPLGLISPSIIIAKVLLQKLWSENLTWDEPLPESILQSWLKFSAELDILNDLKIPRRITCDYPTCVSLHGFADASEASYGACIYIVSTNLQNECCSRLLCAKSKVAPLKSLTIPRLELCAALILSQLISKVLKSSDIVFDRVYCWSDSTIVLGWLRMPSSALKPFVANRIAEIQGVTKSFEWKHVPSADNPADVVSRGLRPELLVKSDLWFQGPPWLHDPSLWPNAFNPVEDLDLPEKRSISLVITSVQLSFLLERFSTLSKLKRVVAYMLRFISNCQTSFEFRNLSNLSSDELYQGLRTLIKVSQQESFPNEYQLLIKNLPLPSTSTILSLHPFIDNQGVLRVGGRLENSDYPYDKKHPMLLCHKHKLTELIFEYEHQRLLHAGPQLLLSTIRETFWPISGRNFARKIVRNCVKCSTLTDIKFGTTKI